MSIKKAVKYEGRVLFLHGFTQSSSVFYAKTSALRKRLRALKYQTIYLNAPFNLVPSQLPSSDVFSKFSSVVAEPDEETHCRAWWFKDNAGKWVMDDAINTIRQYIDEGTIIDGSPEDQQLKADVLAQTQVPNVEETAPQTESTLSPVVGIVGFSQGACLAGALADKFETIFGTPLKFAILYSGFKIDTKLMPEYDYLYTKDEGGSSNTRLLHVVGELDTIVGDDRAYTLYDVTKKNSHVLKHPGGHFVPNSKAMVHQVISWIRSVDVVENAEKDMEANEIPTEGMPGAAYELARALNHLGRE